MGVKILERSLSIAQVTGTFKSHERSLSSAEVFEASRYVRGFKRHDRVLGGAEADPIPEYTVHIYVKYL